MWYCFGDIIKQYELESLLGPHHKDLCDPLQEFYYISPAPQLSLRCYILLIEMLI